VALNIKVAPEAYDLEFLQGPLVNPW